MDTHSAVFQETEARLIQPIFQSLVLPNETYNKHISWFTVSTEKKKYFFMGKNKRRIILIGKMNIRLCVFTSYLWYERKTLKKSENGKLNALSGLSTKICAKANQRNYSTAMLRTEEDKAKDPEKAFRWMVTLWSVATAFPRRSFTISKHFVFSHAGGTWGSRACT